MTEHAGKHFPRPTQESQPFWDGCRNGELLLRWRDGRIEREPDSLASGTGADPMAFDHGMHRDVIEDFVDAVAAGRDAPVPARSVMAVHHLIDAVLASSREGRRLDVAQG